MSFEFSYCLTKLDSPYSERLSVFCTVAKGETFDFAVKRCSSSVRPPRKRQRVLRERLATVNSTPATLNPHG